VLWLGESFGSLVRRVNGEAGDINDDDSVVERLSSWAERPIQGRWQPKFRQSDQSLREKSGQGINEAWVVCSRLSRRQGRAVCGR
jgi:hypothetical protein